MADRKSRPLYPDMARCADCHAWASVPEGMADVSTCGGCGGLMVKVDMVQHLATLPIGSEVVAIDAAIDITKFSKLYRCYRCRDLGKQVAATVRLFSGIGADGFPSCDEHLEEITRHVLEVFDPNASHPVGPGYSVAAHKVIVDKYGHPSVGEMLWRRDGKNRN